MAVLTEEQTMLRDGARDWTREQSPTTALRRLRDEGSGAAFDPTAWASMAEMGWAGVMIPEAHGGSGLGLADLALVLEETGRTLTASPLVSTALGGVSALTLAGTEAQQAAWLPRIAAGEAVVVLAIDEGPHHNPERIGLTAARTGDGYTLSGIKTLVFDGNEADAFVVSAVVEGEGPALFLVEADAPGVSRRKLQLIDSRPAADVVLKDAAVGADARMAGGMDELEQVLDRVRAGLAAEMLGSSLQAFETTLEYLKTRTQFGQLIGSFQALQHRAAIMFTDLEMTRSAVEAAVQALDGDAAGSPETRALVSLAKAKANELFHKVSNETVQMHGGIGMTDVADPGLYLKRARVAEAAYGSAPYHRDRYAKLLGF